jgi:cysteine-rich repeat protein
MKILALVILGVWAGCDSSPHQRAPEGDLDGDGVINAEDCAPEDAAIDHKVWVNSCGDGIVCATAREACDDGNDADNDGCTRACALARCGDNIARVDIARGEPGFEECDDGNDDISDRCLGNCAVARCGDGFVQIDIEVCDDGGDDPLDGCVDCALARCGDGHIRADIVAGEAGFEACDDGNDRDDDGCLAGCIAARCGDGVRRIDRQDWHPEFEACDDANADNSDACLDDCRAAACGDGFLRLDREPGAVGYEACEGTTLINPEDCTDTCAWARLADLWKGPCALSAAGVLKCWGAEVQSFGHEPSSSPLAQTRASGEPLDAVLDAAIGSQVRCVRRAGHELWCWGHLGTVFEGLRTSHSAQRIEAVPDDLVEVVTIDSVLCLRRLSGQVTCQGVVALGVGAVVAERRRSPQPVVGISEVVQLVAGGRYSRAASVCARQRNGRVACWGTNPGAAAQGNLFSLDQQPEYLANPVFLRTVQAATDMAVGLDDICVIEAGEVRCAVPREAMMVPFPGGLTDLIRVDFASGRCIVRAGHVMHCDRYSNFMFGTTLTLPGVVGAVPLNGGRCVRLLGGNIACWAVENLFGQLGDGTTDLSLTPVLVVGLDD